MCDCYDAKCYLCDAIIPMHLGDFATERNEIRVICWKHDKEELKEVLTQEAIVWNILDVPAPLWWLNSFDDPFLRDRMKTRWNDTKKKFGGKFVFVVPLTENAKVNCLQNHPNLLAEMIPTRVTWWKVKRDV